MYFYSFGKAECWKLKTRKTGTIERRKCTASYRRLIFKTKIWRPGRDLNPGHSGDSRIYWAELYYQGNFRRRGS